MAGGDNLSGAGAGGSGTSARGGAQAGQAGDLAAVQGILSFRPTLFRGTNEDSITVQAWCATITKAKTAANWNDARAVDCATENLRDEAATWYANTKNGFRAERNSVTTTWTLFEEAITQRFSLDRTAIQKVNLMRDLQQTGSEGVASFYERVHMAVRKTLGDIIKTKTANPGNLGTQVLLDAFADGVEEVQKCVIRLMFLAGLRSELRQQLQATADFESLTLEQTRTHAIRIEDSRKAKGKEAPRQAIAAVTTTADPVLESIKALQKEIAAVSALNKGGKSGGKTGNATGGKKKKPLGDTPVHQRTSWMRCHKCKQWGLHMARECTRTAAEIGNLTPGEEKTKPAGQAFDTLFPAPN